VEVEGMTSGGECATCPSSAVGGRPQQTDVRTKYGQTKSRIWRERMPVVSACSVGHGLLADRRMGYILSNSSVRRHGCLMVAGRRFRR
jgi:hypothetical protein